MESEVELVGRLVHETMARECADLGKVVVTFAVDDFRTWPGLGRIDAIAESGEVILDAKVSADFEAMIREIEIREHYRSDVPVLESGLYTGRRNKSDRKRNKRDRWR